MIQPKSLNIIKHINRLKGIDHMTIPIYVEDCDEVQHLYGLFLLLMSSPWQKQLEERVYLVSEFKDTVRHNWEGRETRAWGITASHIASKIKKQWEMNAGTQLTFSFLIHPWTPTYGMVPSIFKVGLPYSVNPFLKQPHRYIQKCVSMVIPKNGLLSIMLSTNRSFDIFLSYVYLFFSCLTTRVVKTV